MLCFYLTNEIIFNTIRLNKKKISLLAQENPKAIETGRVFLLHKYNTLLGFYCQLFFLLIESFFCYIKKGGLKNGM